MPDVTHPQLPTRLLTRREAAAAIGAKPQTMANWATKGSGPPMIRIGSRFVRYDPDALMAWAREHTIVAGAH